MFVGWSVCDRDKGDRNKGVWGPARNIMCKESGSTWQLANNVRNIVMPKQ
jgi:hypothetical protein